MLSRSGTSKLRIKEKLKLESAILAGKVAPKGDWFSAAFFMKSSTARDIITGLQLGSMWSSPVGKGGL